MENTENTEIMDELRKLKDEISALRMDIQTLTRTCGRMDTHISFVDSVYEQVKRPFSAVMSGFGYRQIVTSEKPKYGYGHNSEYFIDHK